ncbi:sugar ABC transporter permease [Paenibacillus psychroresistens]|uniref:Sugar ABC transporter permease n=1 Tax=Paenibacillus psychroresistens TaxID=1778678 RepID=A0A6B8RHR8_9BACL|nr:sugar ABC transporter permease [Paenibacillus psychroresistens]QGQ95619.1 sugar ABC transporter permease [Paenibacillus psychroresistens]
MSSRNRIGTHQARMGYLFITPTLFLFIVFTIIPVIMALYLSFTNYDVVSRNDWVGLANYKRIIDDAILLISFKNILYYAVLFIPLNVICSLGLALLFYRSRLGFKLFRTAGYMPTLTSGVAAATVWIFLLNPEYGFINEMLAKIGIVGPSWLAQMPYAMFSIVFVTLWQSIGANMVIYLAGLNGVPDHLYESANLDGANSWQSFRYITWPSLRPTTFFVSTMSIIGALQLFDQAYILTKGGPANSTKTVVYHIYQQGMGQLQMGYADAMAFVLAFVILTISLINMRLNKEESMV